MSLLSSKRLSAVLRRYGSPARLERDPVVNFHLLINELAPVGGTDLPDQVIAAEGVVLLSSKRVETAPPSVGEIIVQDNRRWRLDVVLPLAEHSKNLFEIRASRVVPNPT